MYMYSILGRGSFCFITASILRAWSDSVVALAEVVWSPGSLTVAFSSFAFFWSLFLFFLLTIPHILYGVQVWWVCWPVKHTTPWSFNQLLVLLAVWRRLTNPAGNEITSLKKAGQQKEAWSAPKCLVNGCNNIGFKKHNGPTPADDIAPQIITDCGNLTLDFKQLGLWASPPFLQTLGPWFPNEIQNFALVWKEDFGPLGNSPSSSSP